MIRLKQLDLPEGATTTAVTDGQTLTGTEAAELIAGKDGSGDAQFIATDANGNLVVVGAGTAGTPAGGVVSVQGVPSGTAVPVSLASAPLASGAATSALQTTGNSSLSSINTKLPALGQAAMASSSPVVIASNQSAVPVIFSGTPAVSVNNLPATQPVSIASQPLPSGASTSALQTTGNTSLGSIDTKTPALVSGRVPVDATGTVTAAISGTPNVAVTSSVLPTDAASETTLGTRLSDATFTARVPTLGQATMAASSPVTIASNQPAIAVSGTVSAVVSGSTLTGGTQKAIARGGAKGSTAAADITGTAEGADHQALDVQLYHGGSAIDPQQIRPLSSGTDSVTCVPSGTQAVSIAASVPVTDGGGSLTVDGTVTCVPSGTQTVSGTVTANLGSLNGAATESTLSALNTKVPALGQTTMAASQPVAIASNQSAIPVSGTVTCVPSGTQTVSGSVTATVSGVAQNTTLTNGTAKAIVRGGTKGSTAAADVTSTASGSNHQALDACQYDTAGNAVTSPLTVTGTISSVANSAELELHGRTSVSIKFSATAFVASLTAQATIDGSSWLSCHWIDTNPYSAAFGQPVFGEAFNIAINQSVHRAVILPPGARSVRMTTGSAYTSGSMTYTIAASNAAFPDYSFARAATVKPPSTTATALDQALVVAVSPTSVLRMGDGGVTVALKSPNQAADMNTDTALVVETRPPVICMVSLVPGSNVNVMLLPANASRRSATFYNESSAVLYLKFDAMASVALYSLQIPPNGYFELPSTGYNGRIDGVWSASAGAVLISEFVA
jgi:hypothetical protein